MDQGIKSVAVTYTNNDYGKGQMRSSPLTKQLVVQS